MVHDKARLFSEGAAEKYLGEYLENVAALPKLYTYTQYKICKRAVTTIRGKWEDV